MKIPLQLTDSHELKDMTTHSVEVVSTSSVTADTSPVVLNQTDSLRFRFLPTLVTNEKEPQKSVSGKLVYERKPRKEHSFPTGLRHSQVNKNWRMDGTATQYI